MSKYLLSVAITADTTEEISFAIEEVKKQVAKGFLRGKDENKHGHNKHGHYTFSIREEE